MEQITEQYLNEWYDKNERLLSLARNYIKWSRHWEFEEWLSKTNLNCRRCANCCTVLEIEELNKKAFEPCKHLDGNVCTIHEGNRPEVCKSFPIINEDHVIRCTFTFLDKAPICPIVKDFLDNVAESMKRRHRY